MKAQNLPPQFKNYVQQLLKDESPLFFNAIDQIPPVSVRQNPLKKKVSWNNPEPIEWCESGCYLPSRPLFTADPLFHAGCYYVQEASSMFLEQFLKLLFDKNQAITALDLCAAPGGKSTHLISLLSSESAIFCNEVIPKRNSVLGENIAKWGAANVVVTQNEAKDFLPLNCFFDLVVVDAPCSGEGMFRKDENAIAEWSEKNVETCSNRQTEILENIVGAIKEGGYLIYSTCTFETKENEEKIKWLCTQKGFEEVRLEADLPPGVLQSEFGYRFYPHRVKGEGFFIACLQKKRQTELQQFNIKAIKKQVVKVDLQQVPKPVLALVESYSTCSWFRFKNQFCFTNSAIFSKLFTAEKFLNIKQAGTAVAESKGSDYLPLHSLALSVHKAQNLPFVELNKEQAIKFLKCESIIVSAQKGWLLAMFENIALGWAKSTGERLNNHYPKEWKIRMDIKAQDV